MFAPHRASAARRKGKRSTETGRIGFRRVAAAAAAMALAASAQVVAASPTVPRQGRDVAAHGGHAHKASLDVLDKPSQRFRR